MSNGFLTLMVLVSASGPTGLQKGDELTFKGTVVENDNRPSKLWHREYQLTLRIFILERQENWSDAAVLTKLRPVEDAVGGVSKPVTGTGPDKNAPPIIQLDLVRVHADGSVHLLLPPGPPFRLSAETPARAVTPLPLNSYAPAELGIFPPRIPRTAGPGEPWTVSAGPSRPDETWVAKKLEFVNAEQCQMLVMNQQSPDWDKPVGGQLSWLRAEKVWVSTEDGTARKVYRVIRHRVGLSKDPSLDPALWVETQYELNEHQKLSGEMYNRTRQDVEVAFGTLSDLRNAAKLGARMIEGKLATLDGYLQKTEPGTPYREAILAARRTLDAARHGGVSLPLIPSTTPQPLAQATWPEPGQFAPNFRTGNVSLSDHRGKPVVLVFFKPLGETTDLALAIAEALDKRYDGKLIVMPLVVFGETAAAIQARNRLKLTIPVHEGTAAAAAFGVESVPRFVLIEPDGKIKWTFTGVGAETGFLVKEQVDRLARPTLPTGPVGTTPPPGPTTPPPSPRP